MNSKLARLALGMTLVVLAILLGWKFLTAERRPSSPPPPLPAAQAHPTPAVPVQPEPSSTRTAELPVGKESETATIPAEADWAGTARVFDPRSDAWLEGHDGMVVLHDPTAGNAKPIRVMIRAGRWTLPADSPKRLDVVYLAFDSRQAAPEAQTLDLSAGASLQLNGRWAPPVTLRIVDGSTGSDLDHVELRRCTDQFQEEHLVPGPQAALVGAELKSPIELDLLQGNGVYWARAPSFGWGRIAVSYDTGGVRRLALRPNCAVVVESEDINENWPRAIRIYRRFGAERETDAEPPGPLVAVAKVVSGTPTRWDDFPAGSWWARLETYGMRLDVKASEAVAFETQPDLTARVALHVVGREPPDRSIQLSGSIVLPQVGTWPEVSLDIVTCEPHDSLVRRRITIARKDMIAEDSESSTTLSWLVDPDPMVRGKYVLEVRPFQVRRVVDLVSSPHIEVVEVPTLSEVTIRFLSTDTESALVPSFVRWNRKDAPEFPRASFSTSTASILAQTQTASIRCAPGSIQVHATFADGREAEGVFTVPPGAQEFTMRVPDSIKVNLDLATEGAGVPMSLAWWDRVVVRTISGEGKLSRFAKIADGDSMSIRRAELFFTAPGEYRIECPPLEGFEDPIPTSFTVRSQDNPSLTVELVSRLP